MTQDDIIRMARSVRDGGHWNQLDLINFAALVAAAEREACAKVCDGIAAQYKDGRGGHAAERSAAAIRARSNT